MRHYEIVFLVHPDQSDQASAMAERYQSMIEASGGSVHRTEDWGRRLLAYPIDKIHKAHYFLMNIECGSQALDELTSAFRFNDAVLRHLVVRRPGKITDASPIFQSKDDQTVRDGDSTPQRRRDGDSTPQRGSSENSDSKEQDSETAAPDASADILEEKENNDG